MEEQMNVQVKPHTAIIFPGQGAQTPGMGKDFYENSAAAKKVYEEASEATGLDLMELCFTENDRLDLTEYTQVALMTTEIAMFEALKEKGIGAEVYAGLSLGEYSALVAAGSMDIKTAAKLTRKRGILMQNTVPAGQGGMAAVMGMEDEKIAQICEQVEGIVEIANYNSPAQTVISGEKQAVLLAKEKLLEAGCKRVVELNVSGPFHSSMLKPAGLELGEHLKSVELKPLTTPYVTNVTASYIEDISQTKELLAKQVYSSVRWYQSIEEMIRHGVTSFIEVGPGRTLAGFNKRISKEITTINIQKIEDLEQFA
ncbi:MAG: ACP S-malonyltransferase [Clostridiales bacterium]|nr:ACP S-malonyltransferase [Clostridiales bacterium]